MEAFRADHVNAGLLGSGFIEEENEKQKPKDEDDEQPLGGGGGGQRAYIRAMTKGVVGARPSLKDLNQAYNELSEEQKEIMRD